MDWCSHCGRNCNVSSDYTTNNISCVDCGKILSDGAYYYSQRRTFHKEKVATNELIHKNMIKKSHAARHYKVFEGREMIWCPHCRRKGETSHDHTTGIIHCDDCGKILLEDMYTKKATLFRHVPGRKDKHKLALSMKQAQNTAESSGQLFTKKKITTKCSYAFGKEAAKEDYIMENEEDDYSTNEGRDNKQESFDYSYDYEGGD